MKTRTNYYVSRKNLLTWLMALCMVASAVTRIVLPGVKGSGDTLYVWSQIVLPIESLLIVNDFAQQFFSKQLWESQEGIAVGLSYFKERSFTDDTIKKAER